MWTLRKMAVLGAMGMKTTLAYVASVWASVFVNILQIIVFYYIWTAVYSDKEVLKGITLHEMITYVILSRILFIAISWGVNNWIAHQIQTGQISMELLRPIDYQLAMYSTRIGDFLMFTVLNGAPVLIISALMFGLLAPAGIISSAVFVVSIILAISIAFFIEFIVGLLSFYTTNGWGLQVLKEAIMNFFSGAIVPLVFFPGVLKDIVSFLPFKDMVYTPISIYLGFVEGQELIESLLFQVLWVLVLWVLSRMFFKHALKKIVVQGG